MDPASAVNIAIPFIAQWEQFSPNPYLDAGSYAIGYGNHYWEDGSPVTADDNPITQDRAYQLLTYYVNQVAGAIAPLVAVDVSDNTLAALVDLGYNWGPGRVQQSKLLQLINSGAPPDQVTTQWQVTATTSNGVQNSDLVARRAAEADLAFNGENAIGGVALVLVGLFVVLFVISARKK